MEYDNVFMEVDKKFHVPDKRVIYPRIFETVKQKNQMSHKYINK